MAIRADEYHEWIRRFDTLSADEVESARRYSRSLPKQPSIDVVMPVFDPPEPHLASAITSVKSQIYENWTLTIADDASTRESVRDVLRKASQNDPRVRVQFLEKNGGIAGATNAALSLGSNEFVVMLDHDDVLPPHALLMVADCLNQFPDTNLVYGDFDFIDEQGVRTNPYFKPDYDHQLFLGLNYITQLTGYRRAVLESIGGMRRDFPGSEDYDLALRFVEAISERTIHHIPHILYHWRMVLTSSTHSRFLTAIHSAMKAVEDHCRRLGVPVTVAPTPRSLIWNRVRRIEGESASVKVVVYGGPAEECRQSLDALKTRTEHAGISTGIAPTDGTPGAVRNRILENSTEDFVAFVDARLAPRNPDWLTEMIGSFLFDESAAVGARIVAPAGRVEQSGILLGVREGATVLPVARAFHGAEEKDPTYFGRAEITHRVACVSGTVVVKRSAALSCGGFDEHLDDPVASDLDLCLRLRRGGRSVLLCPHAVFDAQTSLVSVVESAESAKVLAEAWADELSNDGTYNPNLTATSTDFGLADPPRVRFPWRTE